MSTYLVPCRCRLQIKFMRVGHGGFSWRRVKDPQASDEGLFLETGLIQVIRNAILDRSVCCVVLDSLLSLLRYDQASANNPNVMMSLLQVCVCVCKSVCDMSVWEGGGASADMCVDACHSIALHTLLRSYILSGAAQDLFTLCAIRGVTIILLHHVNKKSAGNIAAGARVNASMLSGSSSITNNVQHIIGIQNHTDPGWVEVSMSGGRAFGMWLWLSGASLCTAVALLPELSHPIDAFLLTPCFLLHAD